MRHPAVRIETIVHFDADDLALGTCGVASTAKPAASRRVGRAHAYGSAKTYGQVSAAVPVAPVPIPPWGSLCVNGASAGQPLRAAIVVRVLLALRRRTDRAQVPLPGTGREDADMLVSRMDRDADGVYTGAELILLLMYESGLRENVLRDMLRGCVY